MSEALWAYYIARHGATKDTPFDLVYGQATVEVNMSARRLTKQNDLDIDIYYAFMIDNIDEVTNQRL